MEIILFPAIYMQDLIPTNAWPLSVILSCFLRVSWKVPVSWKVDKEHHFGFFDLISGLSSIPASSQSGCWLEGWQMHSYPELLQSKRFHFSGF